MAAYIVLDIDIHDAEGYEEYRRLGAPSVTKYGGRFLVRGGAAQNLEGDWTPKRIVVMEFDSTEQAQAWHQSVEYRAAKAIREVTAHSKGIVVQGA